MFTHAVEVITSQNGLVKTLCSPLGDQQSWTKIFHTLEHQEMTPTTLLPSDGVMTLFTPSTPQHQILTGLLFDARLCVAQYVFESNANSREWLMKNQKVPQQITLDELRSQIAKARSRGVVLAHNEVIAFINKKALVAVFAEKNELFSRLNALSKRDLIKKELNLDLPVLIITPQGGVQHYSVVEQMRDMQQASTRALGDPVRSLFDDHLDLSTKAGLVSLEPSAPPAYTPVYPDVNEVKQEDLSFSQLSLLRKENIPYHGVQDLYGEEKQKDFTTFAHAIKLVGELDKQKVAEIITQDILSPDLIERAILYFTLRSPEEVLGLIDTYLFEAKVPNPKTVFHLLNFPKKLKINTREKTLAFKTDEREAWGEISPGYHIKLKNWSILVATVLTQDTPCIKLIVDRYPEQLSHLISALDTLVELNEKYGGYGLLYTKDQARQARFLLLTELRVEHAKHHQFSASEKQDYVATFKQSLLGKKSVTDIQKAYLNLESKLFMQQHRHTFFDRLRGKAFSDTQVKFQKVVASFLSEERIPADESEAFKKAQAALSDLLLQRSSHVVKSQTQFKRHFFSDDKTRAKEKALASAFQALKEVKDFISLKLFMESLLIDPALIERRGLSLGSSDTYDALKKHYDDFCSNDWESYKEGFSKARAL